MKHLYLVVIVSIFAFTSCGKDNDPITPVTSNSGVVITPTGPTPYNWGTLVMLQGRYNITDYSIMSNGDWIRGHIDPNPDGTLGATREVIRNSTLTDNVGGTYSFNYQRLSNH